MSRKRCVDNIVIFNGFSDVFTNNVQQKYHRISSVVALDIFSSVMSSHRVYKLVLCLSFHSSFI